MVEREAKPINEGSRRPPKGVLTWAAIAGVVVFVVMLIAMIVRPGVDMRDGPERGAGDRPAAGASQNPAAGS